jgi:hypothetical protein
VPVTDLLMGARIHVSARLAREEQRDQNGKKHHVRRKDGEDREANLVKQLARTAPLVLPIVIASTAPTAGGSPVNRRFAANSRLFPFRFRRGMRKGSGHSEASVQIRVHHKSVSAFHLPIRDCDYAASFHGKTESAGKSGSAVQLRDRSSLWTQPYPNGMAFFFNSIAHGSERGYFRRLAFTRSTNAL